MYLVRYLGINNVQFFWIKSSWVTRIWKIYVRYWVNCDHSMDILSNFVIATVAKRFSNSHTRASFMDNAY